jgi:hypothetical protein
MMEIGKLGKKWLRESESGFLTGEKSGFFERKVIYIYKNMHFKYILMFLDFLHPNNEYF